ncbi:MAG: fibronectin type III domain-containing protein [Bacteroidales bacterium]|nr:fibronectin type III domain-containing protein [Bacteroidales bacterium]
MKKLLLSLVCVLGLLGGLRAQEAETISIGSGDASTKYSPTYTDATYSVAQQIFVAEEMQEKSGKITNFAFMLKPREGQPTYGVGITRKFKIYMVNTDKTSFESTSDWVAVTEQDLVFDGSVTFATPDQWTVVNFTTPFTYKKGKNILLCVNDVTGKYEAKVPSYKSEGRSESRMLYKNAYSEILATNLSSVTGTVKAEVNQVQFTLVDDGSGEELNPAPNAPANLKAEALSDTEIQLTWDAVEGATYNVYQKDVEEAITKGLATTTYTVADLTPGTNYCFTVTAAKDLESEKSEEACAETKSRATTFAVDFNDGIAEMRVFQGSAASHSCPNWASPKDFPFADMVEGVKTYYKGVDGTMAVYSMTYDTFKDEIYTPDNYIVTEKPYFITETSIIEWDIRQAEDAKTDQYSVVVSEDGTNFTDVWFERYSDKTGETKAYSLKDYAGKELYIGFHHYKQTDGGALCLDNVKLVTDSQITPETPVDPTAPTIPDNVKAVAFSSSSIKLTWNASENTTSYNVYSGDNLVVTSVTETSYMVEDLEANTSYCFTVVAVNGDKLSAKSAEVCAKTFEATPDEAPATPTNLKAEALTESTIQLTWDAVEGAKVYNVYQGIVKLLSVSETTHIATSLQAGREYCFTVTAVNDGGESAESEKACATTLVEEGVEKPATPQNFTIKALVKNELQLSWDAVDGATEYNIYEGEDLLGTVTVTVVDMTELETGKEYCFTVTAINDGGESDKTDEVCETTLTGENIAELTSSFNVYPNPVNDKLYIETLTQTQTLTVEIYDVYGRQQSMVNGQQSMVIDVTSLNSGVYFVKVVTENGEAVRRFVKK